jgi:hypothetical protein
VLEFNETTHTYTIGGRKLPSVTEIIKPLYGMFDFVDQELLDYKAEVGTAVHKAIELHIKNQLDIESVQSPVFEYFNQYLKWQAQSDWHSDLSEVRISSLLGYAGTLDIVARNIKTSQTAIIDIKCTAGLNKQAVDLQTAAYAQGYSEQSKIPASTMRRFSLRLTPEKYVFTEHNNPADFSVFLAFLKIKQYSTANNLKVKL